MDIDHLDFTPRLPCEHRAHTGHAPGLWAVICKCPKCDLVLASLVICEPCRLRLMHSRAVHKACGADVPWRKIVKDVAKV